MLEKLRHCFPRWSHAAEARYEQFAALRRQIPLFLFLFFLNALIAAIAVLPTAPRGVTAGWLVCLLASAIMLFASSARIIERRTEKTSTRQTLGWVIASALFLGIAWGGGMWAVYPHVPMSLRMLLAILTITTSAAGAIVLATTPLSMIVFVVPAVLPLFLRLAFSGEVSPAALTITGVVFLITVIGAAWTAFVVFAGNVNARLELAEKSLVIGLLLKDFENTTSDWLWQTDSELRFTEMSERGEQGIRISIDSVIGKTPEEMSRRNAANDPEWQRHLDDLHHHRPFHDFIYESRHDDGSITWISVSGKPRFDRDGAFQGYRGVMSDISERIIAEEARLQAEERLRRSYADLEVKVDERTRELRENQESLRHAKEAAEAASHAKDIFIANISHELRTPLNAIIGFSEIMAQEQMGLLGNPQYTHFSGQINQSGHLLLEIVNDILDLSKSQAGSLRIEQESLAIESIIEPCASILAEEYGKKNIALDIHLNDRLPMIAGDRVRMKQIFLNLLSNAMKFTEEGGTVTLSATVTDDDRLSVIIADTGIGMTSNELSLALEPFGQIDTSLSREHAGTGLGLPLTKKLIELHGGEMRIESAPARGTTVEMLLPLPDRHRDSEAIPTPPRSAIGGGA